MGWFDWLKEFNLKAYNENYKDVENRFDSGDNYSYNVFFEDLMDLYDAGITPDEAINIYKKKEWI